MPSFSFIPRLHSSLGTQEGNPAQFSFSDIYLKWSYGHEPAWSPNAKMWENCLTNDVVDHYCTVCAPPKQVLAF